MVVCKVIFVSNQTYIELFWVVGWVVVLTIFQCLTTSPTPRPITGIEFFLTAQDIHRSATQYIHYAAQDLHSAALRKIYTMLRRIYRGTCLVLYAPRLCRSIKTPEFKIRKCPYLRQWYCLNYCQNHNSTPKQPNTIIESWV